MYPMIPRGDQMQPSEAVARAAALCAEAVPRADISRWCFYTLRGYRDEGGSPRYHVVMGWDKRTNENDPHAWHVCLDADTGETVWQSDPVRFAARYAVTETGLTYQAWYDREHAAYEAQWGDAGHWDYRQYAEFEEHCSGNPSWPEKHFALPGDSDCGYDAACEAAIAYLSERFSLTGTWTVVCSSFLVDGWERLSERLARGAMEEKHLWNLTLVNSDQPGERVTVEVDPVTLDAADGGLG